MTLRTTILRLASRTTGMLTTEVDGYCRHSVSNACREMAAAGKLHVFRPVKRREPCRYYTNVAMRDALQLHVEQEQRDAELLERAQATNDGARAPWPDDAEPVFTDKTIYTQCLPFEPRYAAVDLPVYGGNQRGRVVLEVAC